MEKKSDTYQIASDIQWQDAGEGVVRQIMEAGILIDTFSPMREDFLK